MSLEEGVLENWFNMDDYVDFETTYMVIDKIDISEQNIEMYNELWRDYNDNQFMFGIIRE